jgi:hypothetical protein
MQSSDFFVRQKRRDSHVLLSPNNADHNCPTPSPFCVSAHSERQALFRISLTISKLLNLQGLTVLLKMPEMAMLAKMSV